MFPQDLRAVTLIALFLNISTCTLHWNCTLVIVDVAPRKAYDKGHFIGAISIPIEGLSKEEEDKRYKELIPAGKPVLIHCRKAIFAPNAYKRVVELRPDIPEISYINGAPLIQPYNEWKSTQGN